MTQLTVGALFDGAAAPGSSRSLAAEFEGLLVEAAGNWFLADGPAGMADGRFIDLGRGDEVIVWLAACRVCMARGGGEFGLATPARLAGTAFVSYDAAGRLSDAMFECVDAATVFGDSHVARVRREDLEAQVRVTPREATQ